MTWRWQCDVQETIRATGVEEAVAIAAIVGTVASTGIAIASAMQTADAQSDAAKFNSDVAKRNAMIAQQQAEMDAEAQRRKGAQQQGAARAAYGASGVTTEGSPLDVLSSSAQLSELDRQTILYKSKIQQMGYADESSLQTARGANAQLAGQYGAGTALLTGAAKAAKYGTDLSGSKTTGPYGDGSVASVNSIPIAGSI